MLTTVANWAMSHSLSLLFLHQYYAGCHPSCLVPLDEREQKAGHIECIRHTPTSRSVSRIVLHKLRSPWARYQQLLETHCLRDKSAPGHIKVDLIVSGRPLIALHVIATGSSDILHLTCRSFSVS